MLFTSESVRAGHPDKICDIVSDSLLDAYLRQDKSSKVALETWVKDNNLGVIGEVKSSAKLDLEEIIRKTIIDIGYNRSELGFDGNTCKINLFEYIQKDIELQNIFH